MNNLIFISLLLIPLLAGAQVPEAIISKDGTCAELVVPNVTFLDKKLSATVTLYDDGTFAYKSISQAEFKADRYTPTFTPSSLTLHMPVAIFNGRRYFGDITLHQGGHYFNFMVDAACGFGPYYQDKSIACEYKQ